VALLNEKPLEKLSETTPKKGLNAEIVETFAREPLRIIRIFEPIFSPVWY